MASSQVLSVTLALEIRRAAQHARRPGLDLLPPASTTLWVPPEFPNGQWSFSTTFVPTTPVWSNSTTLSSDTFCSTTWVPQEFPNGQWSFATSTQLLPLPSTLHPTPSAILPTPFCVRLILAGSPVAGPVALSSIRLGVSSGAPSALHLSASLQLDQLAIESGDGPQPHMTTLGSPSSPLTAGHAAPPWRVWPKSATVVPSPVSRWTGATEVFAEPGDRKLRPWGSSRPPMPVRGAIL